MAIGFGDFEYLHQQYRYTDEKCKSTKRIRSQFARCKTGKIKFSNEKTS